MKYTSLLTIFLSFALIGCNTDEFTPNPKENKIVDYRNKDVKEGVVLIKLSPEIGDNFVSTKSNTLTKSGNTAIDTYMQEIGAKQMTRVFPYDEKTEKKARRTGLHLWYEVEFDNSNPVTKVANNFKEMKGVIMVEKVREIIAPQYMDPIISNPVATKANDKAPMDDPGLSNQWHYYNNGSLARSQSGADINLYGAWNAGVYGDQKVIVAIVDGGIDIKHADLAGNIWVNDNPNDNPRYKNDINGYNFCSNTGTIVKDPHGTHVAGTVAAMNNNGIGVCGVAGGNGNTPGVKLMSCQIFEKDKDGKQKPIYSTGLASAIRYAADHGAVICQCSWETREDNVISAAIEYFVKEAGIDNDAKRLKDSPMRGGIAIFAAGNTYVKEPTAAIYPASHPLTIAVAAMAPDFTPSYFSNRGSWVNIMAPGGDGDGKNINGVDVYYETNVYSTLPDDNYGYMPGTSMACPHVSGVAALILSKFGGPDYTNEMLKERLLTSLKPIDINEKNPKYRGQLGVGYIDAGAAVEENKGIAPEAVKDVKNKPIDKGLELKWKAVNDPDGYTASKYSVYYSKKSLNGSNYEKEGTLITVRGFDKQPGEEVSCRIEGLEENVTYYFVIVAEDRWGNKSNPCEFTVKTTKNLPPVITVPEEGKNIRITGTEVVEIDLIVEDPEGGEWKFKDSGTAGVTVTLNDKGGLHVKFSAISAVYGKNTVTITVTDEIGASSSVDIVFEVYQNTAPELIKEIGNIFAVVSEDVTINLSEYFTDKEGNDITYSVKSSREDIITANIENSNLILKPLKVGASEIEITAADIHKKQTVVKIQSQVVNNGIVYSAYPTKVKSIFNIKLNKKVNQAKIKIFTTTGNLVTETDFNGGNDNLVRFDLTNLAGGSYFLIVEANGETHKQAFIKL